MIKFWGCDLVQSKEAGEAQIDWTAKGDILNITPGEETQLAAAIRVPADESCQIDVAVLALQYGELRSDGKPKRGQWQASTASVPISPSEAAKPSPASVVAATDKGGRHEGR